MTVTTTTTAAEADPKYGALMDPGLKARWVAALRSGDYRQSSGQLHITEGVDNVAGFCCLGVLCEIGVADGVVESAASAAWTNRVAYRKAGDLMGPDHGWDDAMPSDEIAAWAGVPSRALTDLAALNDGGVEIPDCDCSLCNADRPSRSFPEIAAYIEANL